MASEQKEQKEVKKVKKVKEKKQVQIKDVTEMKDVYYPFNARFFQKKPEYKSLKYKNTGIARGLKTRKGKPVQRIGKYAGTFRASGHKNPRLMNKAMKRLKTRTHEKRVCVIYIFMIINKVVY